MMNEDLRETLESASSFCAQTVGHLSDAINSINEKMMKENPIYEDLDEELTRLESELMEFEGRLDTTIEMYVDKFDHKLKD